jgi:hypothetical protein
MNIMSVEAILPLYFVYYQVKSTKMGLTSGMTFMRSLTKFGELVFIVACQCL